MPIPSNIQAPASPSGPCANASHPSPPPSTRFDSTSTPRPPWRSIARPMIGPSAACSSSEAEKNPKNKAFDTPSPDAIGSARIAGR